MKLLGSTKKVVDKDKNWENVPKIKSVEVVLVHCKKWLSPYLECIINICTKEKI